MSVKDELIFKKFSVLDDGFIYLVDVMGSDDAIVQMARVSYGKGTKSVSEDEMLIRYLMRHDHSSPFEGAELKFHIRAPLYVVQQLLRHRTFNFNQVSFRYSEVIDEKEQTSPDRWRLQDNNNKQGSSGYIENFPRVEYEDGGFFISAGEHLSNREKELHKLSKEVYEERLELGVAREQARKDIPVSNYTELYFKADLRNLLHFLYLRMSPHAQQEIREYANIIGHQIVAKLFPITWQAFLDYRINSMTFSAIELEGLRKVLEEGILQEWSEEKLLDRIIPDRWRDAKRCRERDEFKEKIDRICRGDF